MKVALLGPLESGKSTLFSAISGRSLAPIGSTAIEEAIVPVPDPRIDWLAELFKPKKTIHAAVDCLDLPGFNFANEHGRTAARHLLEKIRTVDLLVPVVRAFDDPSVPPYRNRIDPAKDLAELLTELLLTDLELVTTRIERLEKQITKPTKTQAQDKAELLLYKKLQQTIETEKPLSSAVQSDSEMAVVKSLGFFTLKPMVVAVNAGESDITKTFSFEDAAAHNAPVITTSAKIAYELSRLDAESRAEFMADLGITESAALKFVHACFNALGLISFLTHGSDEVRAWSVPKGTSALDAAGKVHSDIKRGFIRAETVVFEDLKALGSEKAVKAAGKMRLEGKDYVVRDGDIIHFRFNV